MTCDPRISGAAGRGGRCVAGAARRGCRWRAAFAALGLMLLAPAVAVADDLDLSALRGSLSNTFANQSYSRWDGINFGVHMGVSNMNTDFGNSTGPKVAYILRTTTIENEAAPSNWTTLPSNVTSGRSYGAFLGYNFQWDELVLGADVTYNRMSGMEASAADSLSRQFKTSDGFLNNVKVSGQSSIKLLDYATLRGRAGYAFGQFLPYAVLGVAVGRFDYSNSATVVASGTDVSGGGSLPYSINQTLSDTKNGAIVAGFVGGLGMDVALLPNVFLRGEWEFIAFTPVSGIRVNVNSARVGIGLKF